MPKRETIGVYVIKNLVNGKVYVGSSIDLYRRWTAHQRALQRNAHHCIGLQRAWNKYGESAFSFVVVETCTRDIVHERENQWMYALQCHDPRYGYNIVLKAGGGSYKGRIVSAETGKRISAVKLGHPVPSEVRQKISAKLKGRKLSPETCAKMSASRMGRIVTTETRAKLSIAHKGRSCPPERRIKISQTLMGNNNAKGMVAARASRWPNRGTAESAS